MENVVFIDKIIIIILMFVSLLLIHQSSLMPFEQGIPIKHFFFKEVERRGQKLITTTFPGLFLLFDIPEQIPFKLMIQNMSNLSFVVGEKKYLFVKITFFIPFHNVSATACNGPPTSEQHINKKGLLLDKNFSLTEK